MIYILFKNYLKKKKNALDIPENFLNLFKTNVKIGRELKSVVLIIQYSVWLFSFSSGDESSNSLMPSAALGLISHLSPPLAAL